MKGDSISGIVELKSDDFWQIANERENKYRVELKAYFMAVERDFIVTKIVNEQNHE